MSIALDIGAHRLCSLRAVEGRFVGRRTRTAYAVLPEGASQRRLLVEANVPFASCEDNLVLMGDSAVEFSHAFQTHPHPLLPNGSVPHDDPLARQILASLVESLLPVPSTPNEICCTTLPEGDCNSAFGDHSTEFLTRVVRLRGYRPLAISAGLAVVLAELVKTCFTGIGMVFGASKCEAVVVHQGIELVRCMVPRGGDWIDEQVARECGDVAWDAAGESFLDIDCACRRKEEFHGNLAHPAGELAYLLARLYRELVADLLEQTSQKLSRCRNASEIPRSASIVYAGGATRIGGFSGLVEQMLPAATFPLKICNVLLANDSDYTVARGCLINAELETVTLARVKAA